MRHLLPFLLIAASSAASAADLSVPSVQYATLDLAVAASSSGDRILIADGVHTTAPLVISHDLTIEGSGSNNVDISTTALAGENAIEVSLGVNLTILGVTVDGLTTSRVLEFNGDSLTLNNVAFVNGAASYGAAVYAPAGGDIVIENDSAFEGNDSTTSAGVYGGGAIWISAGDLDISDTTFDGNTAQNLGSAVAVLNSSLLLTDSLFINNVTTAPDGGGALLLASNTDATITGTRFESNTADSWAGGLQCYGAILNLSNSEFESNSAAIGAAADLDQCRVTITSSLFNQNSAQSAGSGGGGALSMYDLGRSTSAYTESYAISDSTFSNNNTDGFGGAVYADGSFGTFTDCSFSSNTAGEDGGAFYLVEGETTIDRSSFANHSADGTTTNYGYGGAIAIENAALTEGERLTVDNSTFQSNSALFGGAIACLPDTDCHIKGSVFSFNAADDGGAVFADESVNTVNNNVFFENTASTSTAQGGAFFFSYGDEARTGSVTIYNNHFVGNEASSGTAIYLTESVGDEPAVEIYNNVFAHQVATSGSPNALEANWSPGDLGSVLIEYNAYHNNQGGDTFHTDGGSTGGGNGSDLTSDPLFLAYAASDNTVQNLYPSASSPLIDAGRPTVFDTNGSTSDIGAFGGPDLNLYYDADGDGSPFVFDCDDTDLGNFPGNAEACDGNDNDCDLVADNGLSFANYYTDNDGDGYGDQGDSPDNLCEDPGAGFSVNNEDCDDSDFDIKPSASEICDGIDNDCFGGADDGLAFTTYYIDDDQDGYGDENDGGVTYCSNPGGGYATNNNDCDDLVGTTNPGETESCDGVDNDCQNGIDDGLTFTDYFTDNDGDGYGDENDSGTSLCADPGSNYSTNNGDCDDSAPNRNPGEDEVCDNVDNDCVGGIDDGLTFVTYYDDGDGDGFGDAYDVGDFLCEDPGLGFVANSEDCDDSDGNINPGVDETCDGIDNDCLGGIDDGLTFVDYYPDTDDDGYGDQTAVADNRCEAPASGYAVNNTDCDDSDNNINPGANEICDGIDNDCENGPDNGLTFDNYYLDADEDGFGDINAAANSSCEDPSGGGSTYAPNNFDCDDSNSNINPHSVWYIDRDQDSFGDNADPGAQQCESPGAEYVLKQGDCNDYEASAYDSADDQCDAIDNDCDGTIDEDAPIQNLYYDSDGDGFGNRNASYSGCPYSAVWVEDDSDCDDSDAAVYPGADEICDQVDNDCNGISDDPGAIDGTTYYPDNDGDGDGDLSAPGETYCDAPLGYVQTASDCDDDDDEVYGGGIEICDGKDNDCAGGVDDGLTFADYYLDQDGDGYGDQDDPGDTLCAAPVGDYALNNEDCDDDDASVNPTKTEICDGIDNDCVGGIDDGLNFITYYVDTDGDLHGDESAPGVDSCAPLGAGYALSADDCDDSDNTTYSGAAELCDDVDNDCNGLVDDNEVYVDFYPDTDGDGYGTTAGAQNDCLPPAGHVLLDGDCDDGDATINPSAFEVCDGIDNNCDGQTDDSSATDALTWYIDNDNDGYGHPSISTIACSNPGSYSLLDTDCDDALKENHPGNTEVCDGFDNDCDALVDQDDPSIDLSQAPIFYSDTDGDGFGDPNATVQACSAPAGAVSDDTDCDDTSADSYPGALEQCDELDNDCDVAIDEGLATKTYFVDSDGDGYGDASASLDACAQPEGYVLDATDCDDGNLLVSPGNDERCDSMDNDCDGDIDEEGAVDGLTYYTDLDSDGYGDTTLPILACSQPANASLTDGDCDETNAAVNPGANEICDGNDNDCDNDIDDDDASLDLTTTTLWYSDSDSDGQGDLATEASYCEGPFGSVQNAKDCDDTNPNTYEGAPELCDGVDNDCDGKVEQAAQISYVDWYLDSDEDGFGDANTQPLNNCMEPDDGNNYSQVSGDCDDTDADVHPLAYEACDGIDNNCNGQIDLDSPDISEFYADIDGDGYGDSSNVSLTCSALPGYVVDGTDCDDYDDSMYPGADEACDGADNDCDGTVDEDAIDAYDYYPDKDADGYGSTTGGVRECSPPLGYVLDNTDCDDAEDSVYPGATEECDGLDNDCNGAIETLAELTYNDYYLDADDDGYGDNSTPPVNDCTHPKGGPYVFVDGDCDDEDADINPSADEAWYDGVDQDCDGASDYDKDGDGFTIMDAPEGSADDCNDENPDVFPGAPTPEDDCLTKDIPETSERDIAADSARPESWQDASPFAPTAANEIPGCACSSTQPKPTNLIGVFLLLLCAASRRREQTL